MKKLFFYLVMTIIAIGLIGCSNSDDNNDASRDSEETYIIKAGHAASPDLYLQDSFEEFKEIIEDKSDGRLEMEIYPNGELGGEREMIESTQIGDVQMTVPSSAPLASFSDSMLVWDVPFLFEDFDMAHDVLDGDIGQEVLDDIEDKELIGLGYWENGFRHLFNSKKPVENIDDMNGLKIRTLENPMQIKAWEETGANASPLDFTELYAALQQGTVDGAEGPAALTHSMKFYEVQDYFTLTSHAYSPWPVVFNKEFFEGLPEDLQRIIVEAEEEVRESNREMSQESEEEALQALEDEGMEVIELSDAEKEEFKEKMQVINDQIKEEVDTNLFDELMSQVE